MNILDTARAPRAMLGLCPKAPFADPTLAFSPYYLFLGGLCAVPLGALCVPFDPFHPRKQGIFRKKHLFFGIRNTPQPFAFQNGPPQSGTLKSFSNAGLHFGGSAEPSTCERVPVNQIPALAFSPYPLALQSPRLFELSTRFLILNFDFFAAFCRPLGSHCSRFPP